MSAEETGDPEIPADVEASVTGGDANVAVATNILKTKHDTAKNSIDNLK